MRRALYKKWVQRIDEKLQMAMIMPIITDY